VAANQIDKGTRKFAAMRKPKEPEQTRAEILRAATGEFATRGLEGARIDAVAKRTRTTRAMIYYYFRSKEGLYAAVLEDAYFGIREAERNLDLAHLSPPEAVRRLVAFTLDYYLAHPAFVALVVAENQSGGRHIREVHRMRSLNASIIDTIEDVLVRGRREGLFRGGFDAIDLHMIIAALGWFQVANRHTFGYVFRRDLASPRQIEHSRALITEMVLRFVDNSGSAQAAYSGENTRK
jgi:AcrR family transcriptional regulator